MSIEHKRTTVQLHLKQENRCFFRGEEIKMGASVGPYWPGMEEDLTEAQLESCPGFSGGSKTWGNWMADRMYQPSVLEAIRKLKAEAILTSTTNGVEDVDVDWVTPQELREAAQKLGEAVKADLPETEIILESYQRASNWVYSIDRVYSVEDNWVYSVKEELLIVLEDIEAIAHWAEEMGAAKMTLEVNW
jgi:hypothetical protein